MSPLAPVDVPTTHRTALGLATLAALLLVASPVRSQVDSSRIDITGRQNLTVGAGARAWGMGGAFLSRADDATAASWNPAGLSYLRQPELTLVGAVNSFDTRRGRNRDSFDGRAIDFGSFTWPVGIRELRGAVQLSYQRAISFDGRRHIEVFDDPDAPDTDLAGLNEISTGSSDGGFDVVSIGTGFRLARRTRLGFTVNRWYNGYVQSTMRTLLTPNSIRPLRQFDLEFRPSGWNANLGVIFSPVEQVNLAAVYKTPFTSKVDVSRSRRDYWGLIGSFTEVTSNRYSSDRTRLHLPPSYGFGMSWRPLDVFTVSADYTRTGWADATIRDLFDVVHTPRSDSKGNPSAAPPPTVYPTLPYPTATAALSATGVVSPSSQLDSQQVRLGLEYVLIAGQLKIPLRGGYFADWQITPDASGKAPRFDGVTAGVGLVLGPILLDVAYVHERGAYDLLQGSDELDLAPGTKVPVARYKATTNRAFASIIYRFESR